MLHTVKLLNILRFVREARYITRRGCNQLLFWLSVIIAENIYHVISSRLNCLTYTIVGTDNGLSPVCPAPSHYLNQWWHIINCTVGNKLQWNLNQNRIIFIQRCKYENTVCDKTAISSLYLFMIVSVDIYIYSQYHVHAIDTHLRTTMQNETTTSLLFA